MFCGVMAKIIFRLDSICPTGLGKVAGVKFEKHEEKSAGGVEGDPPSPSLRRDKLTRFEPWSAAINGISREKTHSPSLKLPPSLRSFGATRWRDKKLKIFFMAHGRDFSVLPGFSRCRFAGRRHGQGNDEKRNGRPRGRNGNICFHFAGGLLISGTGVTWNSPRSPTGTICSLYAVDTYN
jgi:hypothetical protein